MMYNIDMDKPIYANKTVITLGGSLAVVSIVMGGVMWLTTIANNVAALQKSVDTLTSSIVNTDKNTTSNAMRIAVVETQYKQILDNLADVKQSLQKLKDRFNVE